MSGITSMPDKWLITGGCGFIGTSLIRRLMREGVAVRVIDNLSTGNLRSLHAVSEIDEVAPDSRLPDLVPMRCQFVQGDILDEELAVRCAAGADVIVHLAANAGVGPSVADPRFDCTTNVLGTFNYLDAARISGVRRFVFASSGAPIGNADPPIHEEIAPHPVSPYGASKLAGEGYCSAFFYSYGVESVVLRFGNVYGPRSGHKSSVVAKFIRQALAGEALEIYGDGTQTRDYIYIDDLVDAVCLAAAREGIGGEAFQIATNHETTLNELVGYLLPVLEEAGVTGASVVYGESRLGDVRRNFSDTTKAREQLSWTYEVSLAEGLRQTVAWFLARDPGSRFAGERTLSQNVSDG